MSDLRMGDLRYLELLTKRMMKLSDKKLSELSIAEIKEYIDLCEYLVDEHEKIKEFVKNQWDVIKDYWEVEIKCTKHKEH